MTTKPNKPAPAAKAEKPVAAKPAVKDPEQMATEKAAIAEAKAKQKERDKALAAAKKAEAEAEKAAKKAEAEAEKAAKKAAKEAEAKAAEEAKAATKAAKEAEAAEKAAKAAAEREEALKTVAEAEAAYKEAAEKADSLKAVLIAAKKAARVPFANAGTGASTDHLRQRSPAYIHDQAVKTAGGNTSVHCGDETAQKLLGKSLDECYELAASICEEDEAELRSRYAHLNTGMQRMNLGNKIRGVLNAK